MDQRISFISLAIDDLDRSRAFYVDGLGWRADLDVPGEVVMIQVGEHLMLSLWDTSHFEAELGAPVNRGSGVAPLTIAHNVPTTAAVDEVLATAAAAGAEIVQPGQQRDWGGYTGYFADPDGYRWEVAYNPDPIGEIVLP
ncbi:MAG TPA: VOC family protein [Acidimicrobiales bacterium]|jgi:catechol 2,3-dioxygenase-like lactoylglutathione lyase family enzyme|nr:VOC family protein [Acidimicrobiales bacterium]